MFKNLITFHSAEIGLLLFFISFLLIAAWTLTRSRKEIDDWSSLPLAQSNDPHAQEME
jgi:cbb3-type cytochrome oxidase subunit 3